MSSPSRIVAVVAALVVLGIAFVVLRPGDDKKRANTATTATTAAGTTSVATPPPAPAFTTIVVRDGKPVGGVKRIQVTNGDTARIEVRSPDTSDEIHLHGYDLKRDLKAGGRVRFSFTADADGIYEIELEGAGVPIGKLVVEPG